MKPSWIRVGPKFNDTDASKRHIEERHREEGHVKTEAEIKIMLPHAKGAWSHQKLEEERKDSFLEPSEGAQPSDILILDFRPPEL